MVGEEVRRTYHAHTHTHTVTQTSHCYLLRQIPTVCSAHTAPRAGVFLDILHEVRINTAASFLFLVQRPH